MKLNKQVWHGRYYEAGTEVTYKLDMKQSDTQDKHGCANHWVSLASNPKDILNVWECEITQ
jgi:hypothetical protein